MTLIPILRLTWSTSKRVVKVELAATKNRWISIWFTEIRRVRVKISTITDLSSRKIHLPTNHRQRHRPINSYNTRFRRKITPNTIHSWPRTTTPTEGPTKTSTSPSLEVLPTRATGPDSQERTRICPRLATGLRWISLTPPVAKSSLKSKAILICQIKPV